MKKVFLKSFLVLLLMVISSLQSFAFVVDGIYYCVLSEDEGTCAVTSSTESLSSGSGGSYSGDVIIPEEVTYNSKTYKVIEIAFYAFGDCSELTSINIPASVNSIGNWAFAYCGGLTSIVVDADNQCYDSRDNCNAIIDSSNDELICGCKNTTIPASVNSIGNEAFYGCTELTSLNIPASVNSIGNYAFWNCYRLTSINIPASVNSIGNEAFEGCYGLTSINIPASVNSIGYSAFRGCYGLTSIVVDADNQYYDSRDNCNAIIFTSTNELIQGCCKTIIPSSVTSIGTNSFYYCTKLTSIAIPSSVTNIGQDAFRCCENLASIIIPSSVTSIASGVFHDCHSLSSLTIPSSVTFIGDYVFWNCSKLQSIEIPSSVISIGPGILGNCPNLTSIIVDGNNKYYDSRGNCNAIINTATNEMIAACCNTKIPSSVRSISQSAFNGCSKLTSLTVPSTVEKINGGAFAGCSSLEYISLSSSLTSVGQGIFSECRKLKYVIFPSEELVAPSGEFYNFWYNSNKTLYVPSSLVESYKSANGWKDFGNILPIPSTADYSIYAKPFSARPGEQMTLSVMMNNVNPITGWQADIKLPKGFTIAKDEADDDLVAVSTDRTTEENHSIITNELANGRIRIMESSSTNATFEGTSGKVATITINVADDVKDGEYYIEFFNVKLAEANSSATKHEIGTTVAAGSIINYQDGDVNNDQTVDVADLVQVVNFIMERPTDDCIVAAADVNKDGDINGIDYINEIDLIMNYGMAKQRNAIQSKTAADGRLSSSYVNMQQGSYSNMNISLNTQGSKFSLVQFDITLPQGVSIAEDGASILGTNSIKHDITIQPLRNNTYRVLMYSDSKANIREEANGIIALSLTADKDMEQGEYNALITGQLLVAADGTYCKPSTATAKIAITEPTSIDSLASDRTLTDIYTADGVLIRKSVNAASATQGLSKGMYISNGKKVIVK